MEKLQVRDATAEITIGDNVAISGLVEGSGNRVIIEASAAETSFNIIVKGDHNLIRIGPESICRNLAITIGSHVPASHVIVDIGKGFTCEGACKFLMYNPGSELLIGDNCMFSNNIIVRGGELPHLIFDNETGEYLDTEGTVHIGNHVWIGEQAYITKRAQIQDDCIVGARSVVTRQFAENFCVIAGNPATVVRKNIRWIRNRGHLEKGSTYRKSFMEYFNKDR